MSSDAGIPKGLSLDGPARGCTDQAMLRARDVEGHAPGDGVPMWRTLSGKLFRNGLHGLVARTANNRVRSFPCRLAAECSAVGTYQMRFSCAGWSLDAFQVVLQVPDDTGLTGIQRAKRVAPFQSYAAGAARQRIAEAAEQPLRSVVQPGTRLNRRLQFLDALNDHGHLAKVAKADELVCSTLCSTLGKEGRFFSTAEQRPRLLHLDVEQTPSEDDDIAVQAAGAGRFAR
eukprot:scaffold8049_cov286-Pinguiococcus_pyrenoidosus.AAC.3